jgi:hypothetical protein
VGRVHLDAVLAALFHPPIPKAAINRAQSKRFALHWSVRSSRSVWTARVFSAAFRLATHPPPFDGAEEVVLARNPKFEIRDPKENRSPKLERFHSAARRGGTFFHRSFKLISAIGFRASFGLRQSDFGIQV